MCLAPAARLGCYLGSASAGAALRLRIWSGVVLVFYISTSWGGEVEAYSATHNGTGTHGKSVIVLHNHTSHRSLCCAPIGVEGIKIFLQPIGDFNVQAHSAPICRKPVCTGIYFRYPPRENFAYCAPVGDVGMWTSHWDLVVSFSSSSISEWTLALNTWDNTGEAEEESPKCIIDSYNKIDSMVFDSTNPEEVG